MIFKQIKIYCVVIFCMVFFSGCILDSKESVHINYLPEIRPMLEEASKSIISMTTTSLLLSPTRREDLIDLVPSTSVSILNFGDLMLDRNVKKQIDKNGEDYLFKNICAGENNITNGRDIVLANLEGTFADTRRETSKSIAFRFDPALIPMLAQCNLTLFSLANNHSMDMGAAGFKETKKNLTAAGLEYFGEEYNVSTSSILIKNIQNMQGTRIAFVGLNDTHTHLSTTTVSETVSKAKEKAEYVVVNIHWGEEYKLQSNKHQQELGRTMIDAGASAVIGHHPHVVQEIEMYNGKPIFYSLGNFIFDQYFSTSTQQGLVVGLSFKESHELGIGVYALQGEKSQVSVMLGDYRDLFIKNLIEKSRLEEYTIECSTPNGQCEIVLQHTNI